MTFIRFLSNSAFTSKSFLLHRKFSIASLLLNSPSPLLCRNNHVLLTLPLLILFYLHFFSHGWQSVFSHYSQILEWIYFKHLLVSLSSFSLNALWKLAPILLFPPPTNKKKFISLSIPVLWSYLSFLILYREQAVWEGLGSLRYKTQLYTNHKIHTR